MSYHRLSMSGDISEAERRSSSPLYHDDDQHIRISRNPTDYDGGNLNSSTSPFVRRLKLTIILLSVLLVATNTGWFFREQVSVINSTRPTLVAGSPIGNSREKGESQQRESTKTSFPPTRAILQPIYQDTEFNEDGKNKERADNLWKGLFPDGNGVVSLNKSAAKLHGLHETAIDPTNENNGLYIIAGFHTMHCVTVLRTALIHYHTRESGSEEEKQEDRKQKIAPWVHLTHCLDMIRQTLMCKMDTTLMWLHDPDTFADGQLHVCTDFWELRRWAGMHAG